MNKKVFTIVFISLFLILNSCDFLGIGKIDYDPNSNEPVIETEELTGNLNSPEDATIDEEDLEIFSFANSSDLSTSGDFTVEAPQSKRYQTLIFNSKQSEKTVYLGLYDPVTGKVTADITSTALSLVLMNPYLANSTQEHRTEYLNAVKSLSKFGQLKSELSKAYKKDAENALDYQSNPTVYQLVAEIIKEAMLSLEETNNKNKSLNNDTNLQSIGNPPYIEDEPGPDISFVNPRHTWYMAGVYEDQRINDVVPVIKKENLVSIEWGWPPDFITDNERTIYRLGNGTFDIRMYKGLNFKKFIAWDDPEGRATIYNTGQSILYLIDIIVGVMPEGELQQLPNHLTISDKRIAELSWAITKRDTEDFLIAFTELLADNSEGIAHWIWQETQSNAPHQFIKSASSIVKNTAVVLKILGFANEEGPFFWDLIVAPKEVTYSITQNDGAITSEDINNPPEAAFSIYPPAGIIGTPFEIDASESSDDNDDSQNLEFRWDWETDGTWDTNWSSNPRTTKSFSESGSYSVTLEVRDMGGLTSTVSHNINVGGGAGTASHIKLFRDELPWDSNAMIQMLQDLGFTEGQGSKQYEIITSDKMNEVELTPGVDLVIISNDQAQPFYDNYAANQVRFNNFVYGGGSMLWEACDNGWNEGSMQEAGLRLPGQVNNIFEYDNYNYTTDNSLPLISGLPSEMDHNYASHTSFSNLPDGTTIYTINESSDPTLVEFNFGSGWIILTGQPLEHQYDRIYGNSDMEKLLPRIVSYFTGESFNKQKHRSKPILSRKSTLRER